MTLLLTLAPFAALAGLFGWLSELSATVPANASTPSSNSLIPTRYFFVAGSWRSHPWWRSACADR